MTKATSARNPGFGMSVADSGAFVGDDDCPLDWLERARRSGFISYSVLATSDPFLKGVRAGPRFAAFLEKVRREWEAFDV